VDEKYRPYIPESYQGYIPKMDESGIEYQKYMQGQPEAMKFQDKVLPPGQYREEIPLSSGTTQSGNGGPVMLAANASPTVSETDSSVPSGKSEASRSSGSKADAGFMKYLHAPSPGPVVDEKYRPYIPESYQGYIPKMDESGIEYQKYMQGQPEAMKFQDKVLPPGQYREEIPLSSGTTQSGNGGPVILDATAPDVVKVSVARPWQSWMALLVAMTGLATAILIALKRRTVVTNSLKEPLTAV